MRNFTRPINEILNIFNTVQSALAGAERVFEIMDETPETDREGACDVEKLDGDVILNHVKFSYDTGKTILKRCMYSCASRRNSCHCGTNRCRKNDDY